ncbi:MAG: hypothetical protein WAU78_00575 [Roseiarcus sp.]
MPQKSAIPATLARRLGLLRLRRYVMVMMMMMVVVVVNEVMVMHGLRRRGGVDGRDGEADDQGRSGEQFLEHDEDLVFCDSPTSEASAHFC